MDFKFMYNGKVVSDFGAKVAMSMNKGDMVKIKGVTYEYDFTVYDMDSREHVVYIKPIEI